MNTEFVYLGHDNTIDLILKADGDAVDLSSVTKMTLSFGDTLIESTNQSTDPILWDKTGYDTGEVHLVLGDQDIDPGDYDAPLILYDVVNVEGIVWGTIPITVIAELEGAGT